ncbi:MAG TPA: hypothetical protein VJ888_07425 [Mobilitalea sp.]|nr:hypothetical protein [Mobilitalea sp.]
MFGIFATISGVLFSFLPSRRNGVIAPILIILSLISILPPIDAFTVSRDNQYKRLEKVLLENDMLIEDTIVPNETISEEDRQVLIRSMDYLEQMEYTKHYTWLDDYRIEGFERTFGFNRYDTPGEVYKSSYFYVNNEIMTPVTDYDYFFETVIYQNMNNIEAGYFETKGVAYLLSYEPDKQDITYLILKEDGKELIRLSIHDIFNSFDIIGNESREISTNEAEFIVENDRAILTISLRNINIDSWTGGIDYRAEAYILIKIK